MTLMALEDYISLIETEIMEAQSFFEQNYKEVEKPCVVLDIDETALSHAQFHYNKVLKRGVSLDTIFKIHELAQGRAITPTLAFYNALKRASVPVFFVTGRPNRKKMIEATRRNLNEQGYTDWKRLFFTPSSLVATHSVGHFKCHVRQSLHNLGYTVLLNIGDLETDFIGGGALKDIKLSNPFY